ncbi:MULTISPECIES: KpsF/GutQ family sugar-phosphate isomerase [Pseudomonas]|uniref:Arabinose 5-phosphate isomerase n=3 Tax=Pseudomonas lactis TaxID=1615674 RepID=A0ABS9FX72_9PSED|nr:MULTISPECIES: KpsF/GutQ family sugar-phosphate isomerase [Pseudomonas]MCF4973819.1 KpsF/GutQ family sugar-phosphate isomerase [Pseudomonas lactis]MCF5004347.1 KpsF/GutQ family sugar-phosphate isomerase [Pseudomonas lactis]MCF5008781.1 KpsF/GutQ family sugar-phosphate isomerase [Pseudomonas lactis]MCF5015481.1 KpsF/GutQ family sugar-phosphate isomerase [Pseudomonas lactis]MCF5038632.1 KpsF/GutQ family sugar-phosphate isomerase [Pseudomonas lactis]
MNHLQIAKEALRAQATAVSAIADRLGEEFQRAIELILGCKGRVVVCGMGKSGLIGKKMVATFASTGTPSFFLHPAEAFHGDLGMLKPVDVLILISYSGETEEVIKLIPSLQSFGNQIIAMAGNGKSTLAKHADIWLDVSVEREVCPNNLAPTTSTLATMAMGDTLAVALIEAIQFKAMDFARYHPGGSLGRKLLTRVKDVMHSPAPAVSPHTSFHDCLMVMTQSRLGMAIVMDQGKLVGIVTDGDLRRALLENEGVIRETVKCFMSERPHTIHKDGQLSEAEAYMINNKIKALAVTETSGEIVGVVEIFD